MGGGGQYYVLLLARSVISRWDYIILAVCSLLPALTYPHWSYGFPFIHSPDPRYWPSSDLHATHSAAENTTPTLYSKNLDILKNCYNISR